MSHDGGEERDRLVDHAAKPVRTGLIVPDFRGAQSGHGLEAREAEFRGLAEAIALEIVFSLTIKLRQLRPATFLGAGQVATLSERVKAEEIELILIDAAISPVQQRNLERETGAKVLDRTALILEIFGERARTREGVLQVELAHLNYQKGRLVRSWTHLERQRGGFGFMGGPGETQIESDRRQLQERIALLEDRLGKVKQTRAQQRGRKEEANPVVALVGYTNAGKSTLFNRMTGAGVFAEDLLFATLDTTVRRLELPHGREVTLSDTVGFVADLPHDLVAAFRATLEEVVEADLILHVRDIASPDSAAQAEDVLKVLAELGVSPEATPIIEVWNKIDLVTPEDRVILAAHAATPNGAKAVIPVSAATGEGVPDLLAAIEARLATRARSYRVHVQHADGAGAAWLYGHGEIIRRSEPGDTGTDYEVRIDPRFRSALLERFKGNVAGPDIAA
jgi:GTP-binding protein HflX